VTHKCSTTSPGNPLILGSKVKVKVTSKKNSAGVVIALLSVLASSIYLLPVAVHNNRGLCVCVCVQKLEKLGFRLESVGPGLVADR